MTSFYLALHSGSSFNFFPDNTLAYFTTKLYEAVNLKGNWEYGVVEISYPHTFYNIEDGELSLTKVAHDDRCGQGVIPTTTKSYIPGGN